MKLKSASLRIILTLFGLSKRFDELVINQGRILTLLNQNKASKNLTDYEFKVFSQMGEDGIIQFLVNALEIKNKTFIEFGVQDFNESNCRFLMMKDNWSGYVVDGSIENIINLKKSYYYWMYDLSAEHAFITAENVNDVLGRSGFSEDLGLLSIDIDGNDYYVLEAIEKYRPRIIICEFNGVFGGERKITVPYNENFERTKAHYSNLYFGASIAAINHIARIKGYCLVGINSTVSNAFFVREDILNDKLRVCDPSELLIIPKFRESRNQDGGLTFLNYVEKLNTLKGMPVYEVVSGEIENF